DGVSHLWRIARPASGRGLLVRRDRVGGAGTGHAVRSLDTVRAAPRAVRLVPTSRIELHRHHVDSSVRRAHGVSSGPAGRDVDFLLRPTLPESRRWTGRLRRGDLSSDRRWRALALLADR